LDEGQQSTKEGRPCLWAKLAEMAGKHSSEAFNARDDPLEAAVFSVLVEMMMEIRLTMKIRSILRPSLILISF